jgi:hypothetical protein
MFPNVKVDDLCSDAVYQFSERRPVYLELLSYYSDLFDYPQAIDRWKRLSPIGRTEQLWWVMNEAWTSYGTLRPNHPLHWLAITKRALQWKHLPSNFHPWALRILESFDLPRYQAAYHMPADEYEAVARDLPVVLRALREWPVEQLAPPMNESRWGITDQ